MRNRPYIFQELTNSLCHICLKKVEAKIINKDQKIYMDKLCLEHGKSRVLISDDADYYNLCRRFLKKGQIPYRFNTEIERGCPFDCGLCPDHEQHSCLSIIEINDKCNLACPVCYAGSSPQATKQRSMDEINFMLDAVIKNEREPDIVQISGGEPTIHPQFFDIIKRCKELPIKHLMVNTNGIVLAQDESFAPKLAEHKPGIEVYLQFDSLNDKVYKELRGASLLKTKMRALENLERQNISVTLVATVKKGLNDHEMGEIIDFALQWRSVRGVTFQPIQHAGRVDNVDPLLDRITLSEIRRQILTQSSIFKDSDMLPVPCHPDCLAMAYALKIEGKVVPLTHLIDEKILLEGGENTLVFERNQNIKDHVFSLFSTAHSPESSFADLKNLLCCVPKVKVSGHDDLSYEDLFRVLIVQFMDPYNFDVRSVKRSCVHIVHEDGRIIPFDTFNLFYRPGLTIPQR